MTATDERSVEQLQAQARADALANDLRKLADICADSPWFADHIRWQFDRFNAPVSSSESAVEVFRRAARLGMDAGLKVTKDYDDTWGAVTLRMPNGLVNIWVYASRSEVCERVVKGTREVTKEVPDPEALKAVPKVTVTETVEDVEWVCMPILDDKSGAAS